MAAPPRQAALGRRPLRSFAPSSQSQSRSRSSTWTTTRRLACALLVVVTIACKTLWLRFPTWSQRNRSQVESSDEASHFKRVEKLESIQSLELTQLDKDVDDEGESEGESERASPLTSTSSPTPQPSLALPVTPPPTPPIPLAQPSSPTPNNEDCPALRIARRSVVLLPVRKDDNGTVQAVMNSWGPDISPAQLEIVGFC